MSNAPGTILYFRDALNHEDFNHDNIIYFIRKLALCGDDYVCRIGLLSSPRGLILYLYFVCFFLYAAFGI